MSLSGRASSILRWSQCFFLVVGVLALSYCAYALLEARLYQAYQSRQFQQAVSDSRLALASLEPSANSPRATPTADLLTAAAREPAVAPRTDFPLGRIEITRIGLAAMIMEGLDERTLRHAVGHVPGTPAPGQMGNVALAGHRDTFFRPLHNIREDDEIILTTLDGPLRYRVDLISVVEPENVDVLRNSPDAILTLVTCYPFDYIGSAPRRFIVRAHKIPG